MLSSRFYRAVLVVGVIGLVSAGVAVAEPGVAVSPTPGGNYGVTVFSDTPGSPGASVPQGFSDMTQGGGQPSGSDSGEWTEWSNTGTPFLCNPQTCRLPVAIPGSPPTAVLDPLTIAQELATGMQIRRIDIGIVPEPANGPDSPRVGLIGMPVWLWDKTTGAGAENTRGPITRTATVGVLTVTATAVNTAVVWNMGDGGLPVVCPMPAVNNMPSLDVDMDAPPLTGCGRFAPGWAKTSQDSPNEVFPVSATSLWVVTWAAVAPGQAAGGTFPLLPTASTEVRVGEMQVLGAN